MSYERELEFARRAAVLAGENAMRFHAAGVAVETKPDRSPVTAADRDNERLLRELIEAEFPEDGILGEEGTRKDGCGGRRWILDPIDGTGDFVRGNPFWCVLIALETAGEAVLGVAHFPMRAETYWAARASGSYRNGERLRVSAVERTSEAVVSPDGRRERDGAEMTDFLSRFRAVRSPGGALEAALLAAGQIDVWFERRAAVWDLAPLQVIIEEAGGRFFALDGTRRIDGGNAVGCTPALEREVREFFGLG